MKRFEITGLIFSALICSGLFTATLSAALVTELNYANDSDLGSLNGSIFATVTVTASGSTATFEVNANDTVLNPDSNYGIQSFGFNYDGDTLDAPLTITDLPSNWTVKEDQNQGGLGTFEIVTSGKSSTRHDPLVFSVTNLPDLSPETIENAFYVENSDGHHYFPHIAGFTVGGSKATGAYFTRRWRLYFQSSTHSGASYLCAFIFRCDRVGPLLVLEKSGHRACLHKNKQEGFVIPDRKDYLLWDPAPFQDKAVSA